MGAFFVDSLALSVIAYAMPPCSPFCRLRDIFPRPGEVCQSERLWQCGQLSGFAKGSPFGRAVEHCETERARPLDRSEQVKGSARFLSFLFASFFRLMDAKIVLGYNKDKIVLRFAK